MSRQAIGSAIHAPAAGYINPPAPEYRRSCVVELPFTIERGCRTFVALDSNGYTVWHGILEPGGDMAQLVTDLRGILALADRDVNTTPILSLVAG